jgi:acyl carrier protein
MEMGRDEIREKVVQALGKCLARNPEEIKDGDALVQDLGLDSLDFLDLMFALEKVFRVKIRDADFDRLLKPTQNETIPPHLSEEEVKSMSRFIPSLTAKAETGPVPRNSVISMMTTDSLVAMVSFKLNQKH